MKASGKMEPVMALVYFTMLMDLSIWDIGIKILKMEKLYSGMNMDKHFNVFLKMINYKIEFQSLILKDSFFNKQ